MANLKRKITKSRVSFARHGHHALSPILKAEKILPQIFLDITHYSHFGQHILVLEK